MQRLQGLWSQQVDEEETSDLSLRLHLRSRLLSFNGGCDIEAEHMLETHGGSLDDLIVSSAGAFKKWSKQRAKMQLPTLPELPGEFAVHDRVSDNTALDARFLAILNSSGKPWLEPGCSNPAHPPTAPESNHSHSHSSASQPLPDPVRPSSQPSHNSEGVQVHAGAESRVLTEAGAEAETEDGVEEEPGAENESDAGSGSWAECEGEASSHSLTHLPDDGSASAYDLGIDRVHRWELTADAGSPNSESGNSHGRHSEGGSTPAASIQPPSVPPLQPLSQGKANTGSTQDGMAGRGGWTPEPSSASPRKASFRPSFSGHRGGLGWWDHLFNMGCSVMHVHTTHMGRQAMQAAGEQGVGKVHGVDAAATGSSGLAELGLGAHTEPTTQDEGPPPSTIQPQDQPQPPQQQHPAPSHTPSPHPGQFLSPSPQPSLTARHAPEGVLGTTLHSGAAGSLPLMAGEGPVEWEAVMRMYRGVRQGTAARPPHEFTPGQAAAAIQRAWRLHRSGAHPSPPAGLLARTRTAHPDGLVAELAVVAGQGGVVRLVQRAGSGAQPSKQTGRSVDAAHAVGSDGRAGSGDTLGVAQSDTHGTTHASNGGGASSGRGGASSQPMVAAQSTHSITRSSSNSSSRGPHAAGSDTLRPGSAGQGADGAGLDATRGGSAVGADPTQPSEGDAGGTVGGGDDGGRWAVGAAGDGGSGGGKLGKKCGEEVGAGSLLEAAGPREAAGVAPPASQQQAPECGDSLPAPALDSVAPASLAVGMGAGEKGGSTGGSPPAHAVGTPTPHPHTTTTTTTTSFGGDGPGDKGAGRYSTSYSYSGSYGSNGVAGKRGPVSPPRLKQVVEGEYSRQPSPIPQPPGKPPGAGLQAQQGGGGDRRIHMAVPGPEPTPNLRPDQSARPQSFSRPTGSSLGLTNLKIPSASSSAAMTPNTGGGSAKVLSPTRPARATHPRHAAAPPNLIPHGPDLHTQDSAHSLRPEASGWSQPCSSSNQPSSSWLEEVMQAIPETRAQPSFGCLRAPRRVHALPGTAVTMAVTSTAVALAAPEAEGSLPEAAPPPELTVHRVREGGSSARGRPQPQRIAGWVSRPGGGEGEGGAESTGGCTSTAGAGEVKAMLASAPCPFMLPALDTSSSTDLYPQQGAHSHRSQCGGTSANNAGSWDRYGTRQGGGGRVRIAGRGGDHLSISTSPHDLSPATVSAAATATGQTGVSLPPISPQGSWPTSSSSQDPSTITPHLHPHHQHSHHHHHHRSGLGSHTPTGPGAATHSRHSPRRQPGAPADHPPTSAPSAPITPSTAAATDAGFFLTSLATTGNLHPDGFGRGHQHGLGSPVRASGMQGTGGWHGDVRGKGPRGRSTSPNMLPRVRLGVQGVGRSGCSRHVSLPIPSSTSEPRLGREASKASGLGPSAARQPRVAWAEPRHALALPPGFALQGARAQTQQRALADSGAHWQGRGHKDVSEGEPSSELEDGDSEDGELEDSPGAYEHAPSGDGMADEEGDLTHQAGSPGLPSSPSSLLGDSTSPVDHVELQAHVTPDGSIKLDIHYIHSTPDPGSDQPAPSAPPNPTDLEAPDVDPAPATSPRRAPHQRVVCHPPMCLSLVEVDGTPPGKWGLTHVPHSPRPPQAATAASTTAPGTTSRGGRMPQVLAPHLNLLLLAKQLDRQSGREGAWGGNSVVPYRLTKSARNAPGTSMVPMAAKARTYAVSARSVPTRARPCLFPALPARPHGLQTKHLLPRTACSGALAPLSPKPAVYGLGSPPGVVAARANPNLLRGSSEAVARCMIGPLSKEWP